MGEKYTGASRPPSCLTIHWSVRLRASQNLKNWLKAFCMDMDWLCQFISRTFCIEWCVDVTSFAASRKIAFPINVFIRCVRVLLLPSFKLQSRSNDCCCPIVLLESYAFISFLTFACNAFQNETIMQFTVFEVSYVLRKILSLRVLIKTWYWDSIFKKLARCLSKQILSPI